MRKCSVSLSASWQRGQVAFTSCWLNLLRMHWSIYVPVSNLALIPPRRTSFMLFWTAVQILWMFPMDKIAVSQSEISFWFQSLSTASLTSLFHVILHGTICNNVFMVGRSVVYGYSSVTIWGGAVRWCYRKWRHNRKWRQSRDRKWPCPEVCSAHVQPEVAPYRP